MKFRTIYIFFKQTSITLVKNCGRSTLGSLDVRIFKNVADKHLQRATLFKKTLYLKECVFLRSTSKYFEVKKSFEKKN